MDKGTFCLNNADEERCRKRTKCTEDIKDSMGYIIYVANLDMCRLICKRMIKTLLRTIVYEVLFSVVVCRSQTNEPILVKLKKKVSF